MRIHSRTRLKNLIHLPNNMSSRSLKIYNSFVLGASVIAIAAGFFVTAAVFAQTTTPSDIPSALVPLAQELGCTSRQACETVFNSDFKHGLELAEKYNVFGTDPELLRLAETFKTEVLTKLTSAAGENFEEEIIKIAQDIVRNKPALARQLDVNRAEVEAVQTIVQNVKQEGVSMETCGQPAESLSREQLIACLNASKRLAGNKEIVKDYISTDQIDEKNLFGEAMIKLEEALNQGEFQNFGVKNADELGLICLRPGSPKQCDEIAERFFGADGVKTLAQARTQVTAVEGRYLKGAENFILTTPDGRILTGKDEIRQACDQAFSSRNLAVAKACGDLAVKSGFSSPEEVQEGITFLQSIQGTANLGECQRNPQDCEEFIPQAQRSEFNAMRQIRDIMTAEIGFQPERCAEGSVDLDVRNRCLDGSKRALPKLESLASQSPAAQRIVADIKANIAQGERYV